MHRFFLQDASLAPGATVDLSSLSKQITHVLRLRPGDCVLVLDGSGDEATVELRHIHRDRIEGVILDKRAAHAEPRLRLTLFASVLKADKFEWLLQKCTELGVTAFVPVVSERTIARPDLSTAKFTRWQTIVREAAEQSGRGRIPVLHAPVLFSATLSSTTDLRLLPWEAAHTASSLVDALRAAPTLPTQASLLIGPEGGLTLSEVDQARAAGWQIVTLGPRILRAETAAVAAAALILAHTGDLGPAT